jgi:hypothetical protein
MQVHYMAMPATTDSQHFCDTKTLAVTLKGCIFAEAVFIPEEEFLFV